MVGWKNPVGKRFDGEMIKYELTRYDHFNTMNIVPTWTDLLNFFTYYGFTPHTLAPLIAVGILLYLFLNKSIDGAKDRIIDVERCIVEMQGILTNRYKMQFNQ